MSRTVWRARIYTRQTVVIVTYLLLNPWIYCHCVTQSTEHSKQSEETILQDFVQYIHNRGIFCSPTFAFSTDAGTGGQPERVPSSSIPAQANPAAPVDLAVTFHPVFHKLFVPKNLTRNYVLDVKNAVQLSQVLHRFHQNTHGLSETQANDLLRSFLNEAGSILRWEQNAWSSDSVQSTVFPNQTLSLSLLGIGMCSQGRLLGYVASSATVTHPASVRSKICAESGNLEVPQHNRFTFSTRKQERFTVFWLANQCESVPGQLSVIRLSVHPPDSSQKIQ
ncbi:unnamed protein product [Echinostoma caproni]|uniref:Adhesion G-protein coupled receptor D1 n=1 Tax=Echinostoma caproni TaxID=27848 RepID=A0A183AMR1_9TREM|nr:unnamed protein product [Echinostoma caproni]